MNIYKHEYDAGLESQLQNKSIAYTIAIDPPTITPNKDISGLEAPAKASITDLDLYPFNSVLVSVGWNKNDDVFLPEEVWNARNTPVFKKVNYEHNENDIIGVITASLPTINNDVWTGDSAPNAFDLVVAAVLYTKWEDDTLQERMDNIIEQISKGEWFVSMECLFGDFDYALTKANENKIVQRNQNTSYLTKHLRWYGGTGTWNGYSIGRVLKDLTFSGKGLVRRPANEKSVILTKAFEKPKMEILMSEDILKSELAKTQAALEKVTEELNSRVEAAQKEEKDRLEKDLHKKDLTIAELQKEVVELKAQLSKANDKVESVEKDLQKTVASLKEAEDKITKAEENKLIAQRISALVQAGVDSTKAEELVAKWKTASAEQFNDLVQLYTPKAEEVVDVDLSKASVEKEVEVKKVDEEDAEVAKAKERQTALASWISNTINKPINKNR